MPAMWEDMCSNGRGPARSKEEEVSEEVTKTEENLQDLEKDFEEGLQM